MRTKNLILLTSLSVILGSCSGVKSINSSCPSNKALTDAINRFIPTGAKVDIVNKKALSQVPGLCQVAVRVSGAPVQIIYATSDAKYFVLGQIVNTNTKKSLTQEAMQQYMKISKAELDSLNQYVAFSYYNGKSYFGTNPPKADKYIYFITDPKCPFCHEAEPMIQKWADKNNVEVRVILFPLPIHPGAFQSAVGLWCNKKGWNSLHDAYTQKEPLSQCQAGESFVKNDIQLDQKLGIEGTPTIIGMDGMMHPGVPYNDKVLNQWLGK